MDAATFNYAHVFNSLVRLITDNSTSLEILALAVHQIISAKIQLLLSPSHKILHHYFVPASLMYKQLLNRGGVLKCSMPEMIKRYETFHSQPAASLNKALEQKAEVVHHNK